MINLPFFETIKFLGFFWHVVVAISEAGLEPGGVPKLALKPGICLEFHSSRGFQYVTYMLHRHLCYIYMLHIIYIYIMLHVCYVYIKFNKFSKRIITILLYLFEFFEYRMYGNPEAASTYVFTRTRPPRRDPRIHQAPVLLISSYT